MPTIGTLFDTISARYDLFNHLTSMGIDRTWRRRAVRHMRPVDKVLDVAIGTADLSLEILRQGKAKHIVGIDLSSEMMRIGQQKATRKGWADCITFTVGSALDLPYDDAHFDALTCAYGVRNFSDLDQGLREFYRVLKPGGQLLILEFSYPQNRLLAALYTFYFRHVMTPIGAWLTHDRPAFEYFYRSVRGFDFGRAMQQRIESVGFRSVSYRTMTFGISTYYLAQK